LAEASGESFAAAVKEHYPQIVGMSALLTTTMPKMEETIEAFHSIGKKILSLQPST
jgi:5-methyltetrahydrofolate--homocysteine methyltransferase